MAGCILLFKLLVLRLSITWLTYGAHRRWSKMRQNAFIHFLRCLFFKRQFIFMFTNEFCVRFPLAGEKIHVRLSLLLLLFFVIGIFIPPSPPEGMLFHLIIVSVSVHLIRFQPGFHSVCYIHAVPVVFPKAHPFSWNNLPLKNVDDASGLFCFDCEI